MSASTNPLVSRSSKPRSFYAATLSSAAALALGGTLLFQHGINVHAANTTPAQLPDSSVSPLLSLDQAVENVAQRVSPSVVNIAVTSLVSAQDASDHQDSQQDGGPQQQQGGPSQLPPGFAQFFGQMGGGTQMQPQQPQIEHGIASGVIISPDGYIITNNHVVQGGINMKVTLKDRRIFNAHLVGTDKMTDIAVIKIDATNLPTIPWGDSAALQPGESVLAFGSPFGYFQNSVTRGIVSAVNRGNPYSNDARKPASFIQTDAAINPGNSGGALVNAHGQLIGIPNSIVTNSGSFAGVGFAIPSQIARNIAEQLIKHGKVEHGYLGISMSDVLPDNAHFFKLKDAIGAIVGQVTPGSPAARANIQAGDVIVQLNGHPVDNASALQVAVSEDEPGQHIALGIIRNGNPQTVDLTVGRYSANGSQLAANDGSDASGSAQPGKLGVAVANLTPDMRQQLQLPQQVQGVAIENVRPSSPAEDAGLQPGDVILEVNRQPVTSAEQFASQIHSSQADDGLLLRVWSHGNASFIVVRPDSNVNSQSGM
jgi:serine protease Do